MNSEDTGTELLGEGAGQDTEVDGSGVAPGSKLARTVPFAMVVTDPNLPDNPIVYVNAAFERMTRYTADYAIGRNCRFLQGEDTDPETVRKISEAIKANEDISVDILNYRADGEAFHNRLLIAPLFDQNGKVSMLLGIQRELPLDGHWHNGDSKEAADAGAAVRAASQASDRDGFDAVGSDEPLTTLRSRVTEHMATLQGLIDLSDDDLNTEAPRNLGRRIESLQLLYEELDQAGVTSVEHSEVPVGAYLSRVAATLTHLEGRRSIRVNVDCDEAVLPTPAAAKIGLLMAELLINALRHAFVERREGLVNVEFKVLTGDRARIMVKDDGVGLSDFEDWPFTRDERAEDAEEERSGYRVGAKLTRQLVETLGATIDMRSDKYGTTAEVGLALDKLVEKARSDA